MKTKKCASILFLIITCILITGCSKEKEKVKIVETLDYGVQVIVDTETNVAYLKTKGSICMMQNEDGSPRIWSEEP